MVFRRAGSRSSSGDDGGPKIYRVLNPEFGASLLDPYIPVDNGVATGITEFRILPAYNAETGIEEDLEKAVLPCTNFNSRETPYEDVLGNWAATAELAYKVGMNMSTFQTGTWTTRAGEEIDDNYSAARVFMLHMSKKLKYAEQEIIALGPNNVRAVQSIPQDWIPFVGKWDNGQWRSYREARVPFLRDAVLCQCVVRQEAGHPIIDSGTGQTVWKENCVGLLPVGAVNDMIRAAGERRFGDFVTAAGGHMLELHKFAKGGGDGGRAKWEYELRIGEPMPLEESYCKGLIKPWEGLFLDFYVEDVIGWLAEAFSWQAVGFALRETKYEQCVEEQHLESAKWIMPGDAAPPMPQQQQQYQQYQQPPQQQYQQPPQQGYYQQPPQQQYQQPPQGPPQAPPGAPPAQGPPQGPPGAPPAQGPPQGPPGAPPQAPPAQGPPQGPPGAPPAQQPPQGPPGAPPAQGPPQGQYQQPTAGAVPQSPPPSPPEKPPENAAPPPLPPPPAGPPAAAAGDGTLPAQINMPEGVAKPEDLAAFRGTLDGLKDQNPPEGNQ